MKQTADVVVGPTSANKILGPKSIDPRSNTRQQLHKQIHQLGDQDTRDHTHHQQYMHPMLYDKGNMHVMQCVGDVVCVESDVVVTWSRQTNQLFQDLNYKIKISTPRSRSQDSKTRYTYTQHEHRDTETQHHTYDVVYSLYVHRGDTCIGVWCVQYVCECVRVMSS